MLLLRQGRDLGSILRIGKYLLILSCSFMCEFVSVSTTSRCVLTTTLYYYWIYQLADGGCRDTDSNEFIINHLHNYKSANTTIHGDSGTIAEYDEDEVAEILHAM